MQERLDKFSMPIPWTGCWLWLGSCDRDGYGKIDKTTAHRAAFQHYRGTIAHGLEIDHTCEVRCCVNPQHLDVVTHEENLRRTYARGRHFQAAMTHCGKGHPFSGDNLYVNPNNGKRICNTCIREHGRKHDAKRSPRVRPR